MNRVSDVSGKLGKKRQIYVRTNLYSIDLLTHTPSHMLMHANRLNLHDQEGFFPPEFIHPCKYSSCVLPVDTYEYSYIWEAD